MFGCDALVTVPFWVNSRLVTTRICVTIPHTYNYLHAGVHEAGMTGNTANRG